MKKRTTAKKKRRYLEEKGAKGEGGGLQWGKCVWGWTRACSGDTTGPGLESFLRVALLFTRLPVSTSSQARPAPGAPPSSATPDVLDCAPGVVDEEAEQEAADDADDARDRDGRRRCVANAKQEHNSLHALSKDCEEDKQEHGVV
eukprot:350149-Chlamydomonas_euryale.AAC.8